MAVQPIYQFLGQLPDCTPARWRRFQVLGSVSMARLAYITMIAFDIPPGHLFRLMLPLEENLLRRDPQALKQYPADMRFQSWEIHTGDEPRGVFPGMRRTGEATFSILSHLPQLGAGDHLTLYAYPGKNVTVELTLEKIFQDRDLPGRDLPRILEGQGPGVDLPLEDLPGTPPDFLPHLLEDLNFRVKKLPRWYADLGEQHSDPGPKAQYWLNRGYLKDGTGVSGSSLLRQSPQAPDRSPRGDLKDGTKVPDSSTHRQSRQAPDRSPAGEAPGSPEGVYQFRVELERCIPTLWRQFQVPAGFTVAELCYVLMAIFRTFAYHLYLVTLPVWDNLRALDLLTEGRKRAFPPVIRYSCHAPWADPPGTDGDIPDLDAARYTLRDIELNRPGDTLLVEYDLGQRWCFRLTLERLFRDDSFSAGDLPRVLAGEGYGILEDCGGPDALEEILTDPALAHSHLIRLNLPPIDLKHFDLDDCNRHLAEELPKIRAAYQRTGSR